eukprot:TRINITY_DN900_c0_g1_i7.p2 TRINITY_DN900_c0_g1~~TRINITY_DN900_c0_g1_i7.p2  ORF type:complete len:371 (-),score=73.47 TRINITY_DN900_c0_g1_i7:1426-2373(-)
MMPPQYGGGRGAAMPPAPMGYPQQPPGMQAQAYPPRPGMPALTGPNPDAFRPYQAPPPYGGGMGGFMPIADQYQTIEQVQNALRMAGLVNSNLVLAIDYTKSNEETGRNSFGGRSLHSLIPGQQNPYQRIIDIISRTLSAFDADNLIPVFGFGDASTQGQSCFPFKPDGTPCRGVYEVLQRYEQITPCIQLWGPTSFAPVIRKTIEIVQQTRQYHILVIIADGLVNDNGATREAIVQATNYPISIVMVGVGDGPFDAMREFDDGLPNRRFDNFQFVDWTQLMIQTRGVNLDVQFAVRALQEIPEQIKAMRRLGLM